MNYYEHHLGDYARDAGHLSMIEDGAYRRLIDVYYAREMPLPVDIKECQKLTRCTSAAERKAVQYVLEKFFRLADDGYHQKRCDEEIGKAKARIEAARLNGKKGGRPKANHNPELTQEEPNGFAPGSNLETQPFILANPEKSSPPPTSQSEESKSRCAAVAIDPGDPRKQLWDLGLSILGAKSRSLLAKAIGDVGEAQVGEILGHMAVRPTADPRSYFVAATKPKQRGFVA